MRFNYYQETDSLYIDLSEKTSVNSIEVSPDVVIDYEEAGNIVGIDIDNASRIINLSSLDIAELPVKSFSLTNN